MSGLRGQKLNPELMFTSLQHSQPHGTLETPGVKAILSKLKAFNLGSLHGAGNITGHISPHAGE